MSVSGASGRAGGGGGSHGCPTSKCSVQRVGAIVFKFSFLLILWAAQQRSYSPRWFWTLEEK